MIIERAILPRSLARFSGGFCWFAVIAAGSPAFAAKGVDGGASTSFFWIAIWLAVLMALVFFGYLRQNRMVKSKTAELRRELFERQMAEKELLASEQHLRRSLTEKESLLKEIHHRVKNNLAVMAGFRQAIARIFLDQTGIGFFLLAMARVGI